MSECKWPDHIFILNIKSFKICIYHRDPKKKHPSLYCIGNDHEAYPISIELLNAKNKVINENNNNGYNKKLWSIMNASTDFKIKHSYCEFSIQFDSLPSYFEQPLRFRFKAKSNNPKIPIIEPFTTRPFRIVYVFIFTFFLFFLFLFFIIIIFLFSLRICVKILIITINK